VKTPQFTHFKAKPALIKKKSRPEKVLFVGKSHVNEPAAGIIYFFRPLNCPFSSGIARCAQLKCALGCAAQAAKFKMYIPKQESEF
jgi:hypothetical protein